VLTTAAAVNQMKREEAEHGAPVKIQGVVICVVSNGMPSLCRMPPVRFMWLWIRQSFPNCRKSAPFWKWKVKTDKAHLPRLCGHARSTSWVWGACRIHPTDLGPIDEWQSGRSIIEIRGMVEQAIPHPDGFPNGWSRVFLRTPGGVLRVDLWLVGTNSENLENYEDAVVRLRDASLWHGTLSPINWSWGTFTCGLTPSWWTGLRWRINFPRRKSARRN